MEEKDITKEFAKIVGDAVPEIKEYFAKVRVYSQGEYISVRTLGKNTLNALAEKEPEIIKAVSEIIPNPKILFSAVEENSPRAQIFKRERASYTFSNFIVSDTNRGTFNAMKEISQEPTGQPVVLFGPPSVGKTHLLKALQYEVKRAKI